SPVVSRWVAIAYRPLIWSANRCSPIATAVLWYARLGAQPGDEPVIGGEQMFWWGRILGAVAPYHTTISWTVGDAAADAGPETADGAGRRGGPRRRHGSVGNALGGVPRAASGRGFVIVRHARRRSGRIRCRNRLRDRGPSVPGHQGNADWRVPRASSDKHAE